MFSSDIRYDPFLVSWSSPITTLLCIESAAFACNLRFSCTLSGLWSMNPFLARKPLVKYVKKDATDDLFYSKRNANQIATYSGLPHNKLSRERYFLLGWSYYLLHLGEQGCSGHRQASSRFCVGRNKLSIAYLLIYKYLERQKVYQLVHFYLDSEYQATLIVDFSAGANPQLNGAYVFSEVARGKLDVNQFMQVTEHNWMAIDV